VRIAIVGAKGYLARHFLAQLTDIQLYEVSIFSNSPTDSTTIPIDILDLNSIRRAFLPREFDLVINFAGRLSPIDDIGAEINVNASANIASVLSSLKRSTTVLHLASSLESETGCYESDYARYKSIGTMKFVQGTQDSGVGCVVVKLHNVIGKDENTARLFSRLVSNAKQGLPSHINFPKRSRDFVYIDDFVNSLLKIVGDLSQATADLNIRNSHQPLRQLDWEIGTGIGTTIKDLALQIYESYQGGVADLISLNEDYSKRDLFETCVADTLNPRLVLCKTSISEILQLESGGGL
jgi:nucleoside-diphosphate-sugar epimerase